MSRAKSLIISLPVQAEILSLEYEIGQAKDRDILRQYRKQVAQKRSKPANTLRTKRIFSYKKKLEWSRVDVDILAQ